MKKFIVTLSLLIGISGFNYAQNTYEDFVRQRQQEMQDFKNKADAEFAKYLEERWAEFETFRAIEAPAKPKPKTAPVAPPEVILDLPKIPDAPDLPDVEFDIPDESTTPLPLYTPPEEKNNYETVQVDFFKTPLYFQIDKNMRVTLSDIKEPEIAKAWEQLSKSDYTKLLEDCKTIAGKNGENDWAFYELTKKIAAAFFDEKAVNEQYLLQMFILSQAGYKVKIARSGSQLFLLTASQQTIYGMNYIKIDDISYYILNGHLKKEGELYYTYKKDFSNANNVLNLVITKSWQEGDKLTTAEYQAKGCNLKITVGKDDGLKSFYTTFPQCDVVIHAQATVSDAFAEMIVPQFKQAVAGKTEQEAVSMILNFCQTAFDYMTDPEQFGFEKPFFPEELFYYPYSDCEDRSIIFTYLIHNVLNMDAVLLDYPEHIAAAVFFNEDVKGDYIMVGDKKYVICDPTYINASIGMEMPEFKNKGIHARPIAIKN